MRPGIALLLAMAAVLWCAVGYLFSFAALTEDKSVPSVALAIAVYLPIVGSGFLGYGLYSHARDARFAARRAVLGAVSCLVVWAIAAAVVVGLRSV
jgi:hypothetical protein